ncbi:hypothetical protein ACFU7T_13475 [Streptomyces sp. NPDC057555]|uniref:hypothetical protein n=1 Tax=Streptomyces sp. NPDC057555 TaxID=3346166 RepID=UPI003692EC8D
MNRQVGGLDKPGQGDGAEARATMRGQARRPPSHDVSPPPRAGHRNSRQEGARHRTASTRSDAYRKSDDWDVARGELSPDIGLDSLAVSALAIRQRAHVLAHLRGSKEPFRQAGRGTAQLLTPASPRGNHTQAAPAAPAD